MSRKRKGDPVNGWVILDKPAGLGSTTAVSIVRRVFNAQKAGHAGTLDPAASGVLPIALGEATKTIPYVMDGEKTYAFTVRFGQATDTDDAEGEVVAETDVLPDKEAVLKVLPSFIGEIEQVPPNFSAIHVNGQRAYDLARAKQTVDLEPRRIRIDGLRLIEPFDPLNARFEVDCGKGTYVRSLARDIAQKAGSLGYVTALRRIKCAKFSVQSAFLLEYLKSLEHSSKWTEVLLPVETVLDDIPALAVTRAQAEKLSNGNFLPSAGFETVPATGVFQAKLEGRLIALVRVQDGMIRPVRLINQ
ncbi:MAG: tRNA pseudouridine(55) synthase TruB [Alphaproteobacteria bacterium]|nr:tRNA pseudouridine(55) synthase TruB [Alphaproteobacteria bacterium]